MRPLIVALCFLAMLSLGFWAYRENYATHAILRDVAKLQDEIAGLRENLSTQRAEWAYLNRPDRLRELVVLNFDKLRLLPMEPAQFGQTSQVAFPPPPVPADAMAPLDGAPGTEGGVIAPGAPVAGGLGIDSPIDLQGRTDPAASAIAPAAPSTSEEQIP